MITKRGLWAIVGPVLAGFLVLFAVPAAVVHGATLYEQLNESTLGETNTEHIGNGIPTQKLGTGLSGVFGSMAYKINGSAIASDIANGYGGFKLYSCFTSSYALPCTKVTESDSPPQILSQSGNDAYLLATTTSAYPFSPDINSNYFLQWSTAGDWAFYGAASTTDPYANGLAQWLNGTMFEAEAKLSDVAFRICSGAVCDLMPPDTTAPALVGMPGDIVAEATSSAGVSVTYTAPTATDAVDGTDTVSCTPASGSGFAMGSTTVTCSAADAAGNATSSTFVIGVVDTTAPVLTLSGSATVSLTVGDTFVDQGATATDLGTSTAVTTTGSVDTAASGTYTLTYSATDASGNTASTTRTVTVTSPPPPPPPPPHSGGNGPPVENPSQGLPQGIILGEETRALEHASDKAISTIKHVLPPTKITPPSTLNKEPAPEMPQTVEAKVEAKPVKTPPDKPAKEQIPMGAALATSGLQLPLFVAMGIALLLLTIGAAMALRHSKVI